MRSGIFLAKITLLCSSVYIASRYNTPVFSEKKSWRLFFSDEGALKKIKPEPSIEEIRRLTAIELEQYFDRIGASRDMRQRFLAGPSLRSLCEIHRLQTIHVHVTNYPMHEVSRMHEQNPISPFFKDIFAKIVIQRGHGYCFDNNQLLRHILVTLGYNVNFYNARIIRNAIPNKEPQHVILVVEIAGKKYLVDAGYGGVAPIPVIECRVDEEQLGEQPWKTTDEMGNRYKFTLDNEGLVISHLYFDDIAQHRHWKPLYLFKEIPCSFAEFYHANHSVCKKEETTPFKTTLFETAFNEKCRFLLKNNSLQIACIGSTLLYKPVMSEKKFNKYSRKYLLNNSKNNDDDGEKIRARVAFGTPPKDCLDWHLRYKSEKNKYPPHLQKNFWISSLPEEIKEKYLIPASPQVNRRQK